MANQYTTKTKVEEYLNDTVSASDAQVIEWVKAVSNYIEQVTGRVFVADSVASDRLFVGSEGTALIIDDCVSISNVYKGDLFGENFSEVTEFLKFPLNSTPYTKIVLTGQMWGEGIHKVKAKWGYSTACPEDIALACTILVAGIVNADASQVVSSESIGSYKVSYSNDKEADYLRAKDILDSYKRVFI